MSLLKTSGRYYLNGIDWVMAALNRLNEKTTGAGNHSQLVLILKGYLDCTKLSRQLSLVLSRSDFYKGKTKRAWHLAPYWSVEKQSFSPEDLKFYHIESKEQKALDSIIKKIARSPFKDKRTLLAFALIHFNEKSYLLMKFDHKMFDARGAEALLEYILDDEKLKKNYQLPQQAAQLNLWKSRFLSGQVINRFLRRTYPEDCSVASLENINLENSYTDDQLHHDFFMNTFTETETENIDRNTIKNAGYLMNGIYLLSFVAKAFDSLFRLHKISGNMLVPINVDVRETKFTNDKIFFNNVSFMLFNTGLGLSVKDYIKNLKGQFIDQVKEKIPFHFINAALLLRIMPLNILASFIKFRMKKNPLSFSFSYISEQAFFMKQVQGHDVINLLHMPLVPVAVGSGVFFTRFNKKLNMIVSCSGNTLRKNEGEYIKEKIISGMIDGKS